MTVYYTTRYALTNGIEVIDIPAEPDPDGYLGYISNHPWRQYSYSKKEWHRTPEVAIARANEMRLKKIASLKKQIAKLENMTFEVK
jgi:hypothetical protein